MGKLGQSNFCLRQCCQPWTLETEGTRGLQRTRSEWIPEHVENAILTGSATGASSQQNQ